MIRRFAALALLAACAQAGPTYTYPDNSDLPVSSFIDVGKAVVSLHPRSASQVEIRKDARGAMLLRWSQVVTPTIALSTVAPGRMVYEITETYTHPFTVGPDRYRWGRRRRSSTRKPARGSSPPPGATWRAVQTALGEDARGTVS